MNEMGILYIQAESVEQEALNALNKVLGDITPVVESIIPNAVLADVRGSTRLFQKDAVELGKLVRVRALAWHDLECTVGVSVNPLLARMAAHDGLPGAVRFVDGRPESITAFLSSKPVAALYGVGPKTAKALCSYGLDTVDKVANTPPLTLQRILGVKAGRLMHQRARGIDATSVVPNGPSNSLSVSHRFDQSELDANERRKVLLALSTELGYQIRVEQQVARALTLRVLYADRTTTTRTRRLTEPTAHTPILKSVTYALHEALGLQRARVIALSLCAEDLTSAKLSSHQLTFDRRTESARRLEPVIDRAVSRWPGSVRPAALVETPRRTA